MDLVSLSRFESISKDMQGMIEVKYHRNFPGPKGVSPIAQQFFQVGSSTSHHAGSIDDEDVSNVKVIRPVERPPLPPQGYFPTKTAKTPFLAKILYQAYRGFSIGFIGKFIFNNIPGLIKKGPVAFFKSLGWVKLFNPLRWGLFSGSFLAIFHSLMGITKNSQDLNKHQRSFLSSFIAGWSLLFIPKSERTGVAVFVLVRAIETLARTGLEAGILPYIPHADSLLFGICVSQIVFSWIFAPFAQDGGYNMFLNTHTGNRAQGTQQALAYLHVNANPVDVSTSPTPLTQNIRPPLGHYHQHESGIVTIPGGVLEGQKMGFAKLKGWEAGLGINETIEFYKKRGLGGAVPSGSDPLSSSASDAISAATSALASASASDSCCGPSPISTLVEMSPVPIPSQPFSVLATPLVSTLSTPGLNPLAKALALRGSSTSFVHTPLGLDSADLALLPQSTISNAPVSQRPTPNSILPEELIRHVNFWHKQRGQLPLFPHNLTDRSKLMCQILHPKCPNACLGGQLLAYPGVLKAGLRTYAPVYIIPGLLFRYKQLFSHPNDFLFHVVTSTFRSAAFFANMTLMSHVFACYTRHGLNAIGANAYNYYLMPGLTGIAAFLALLLEQKSKRIELALFSFSHALRSMTKLLLISDRIPLIPWANTALFSVSIAVLISAAMSNPSLLRSSYFSLLRLWLGKDTPGLATSSTAPVFRFIENDAEGDVKNASHGREQLHQEQDQQQQQQYLTPNNQNTTSGEDFSQIESPYDTAPHLFPTPSNNGNLPPSQQSLLPGLSSHSLGLNLKHIDSYSLISSSSSSSEGEPSPTTQHKKNKSKNYQNDQIGQHDQNSQHGQYLPSSSDLDLHLAIPSPPERVSPVHQ